MGTTMACYHILNQGFKPDELAKKLKALSPPPRSDTDEQMDKFILSDILKLIHGRTEADNVIPFPGTVSASPQRTCGMLAYKAAAKWLPYFETELCEGYTASSGDAKMLSLAFGAPVLALSTFDSDIMFVSFSDAAKNIGYDFAKPNSEWFEDFDAARYRTAFPEFMLDFCKKAELKEIWDEPDVVFADDRMRKICKLIGAEILYDFDSIPEGFEAIYAQ